MVSLDSAVHLVTLLLLPLAVGLLVLAAATCTPTCRSRAPWPLSTAAPQMADELRGPLLDTPMGTMPIGLITRLLRGPGLLAVVAVIEPSFRTRTGRVHEGPGPS